MIINPHLEFTNLRISCSVHVIVLVSFALPIPAKFSHDHIYFSCVLSLQNHTAGTHYTTLWDLVAKPFTQTDTRTHTHTYTHTRIHMRINKCINTHVDVIVDQPFVNGLLAAALRLHFRTRRVVVAHGLFL